MKKFNLSRLIFAAFFIFSAAAAIVAQDETPSETSTPAISRQNRPNLMTELNLSTEQRQMIRQINVEKRLLVRNAQERLRQANRSLDQAIYADNLVEAEVQTRIKEVHAAQAELLKIRSTNELAVRKILNSEQLAKFRSLREQFGVKMVDNFNQSPKSANQNQNQRFQLRPRRIRRKMP